MLEAELTVEQLNALKIRSGEHVAAIVATMIHFEAPLAVDVDGGPDLQFGPSATWERPGVEVAYEVKSIVGDFRKFDARLGDPGAPQEFSTVIRTIDDIVGQAAHVVRSADQNLAAKVSNDVSRNVILVLHPFDRFPIEITDMVSEQLVGAGLSTRFFDTGLETVTLIVLPPGSIAQWTRKLNGWQSITFVSDPDDPAEDDEPPIMTAESEFLVRLRPGVDSPYNVQFTVSTDDE